LSVSGAADRGYAIDGQAVRIILVAAIMLEGSGCGIESVQTAVSGADPKPAVRVFEERRHEVIRNRSVVLLRVSECNEVVAVVTIQPVHRSEPDKPLTGLQRAEDGVQRKTLFGGNALELDILMLKVVVDVACLLRRTITNLVGRFERFNTLSRSNEPYRNNNGGRYENR